MDHQTDLICWTQQLTEKRAAYNIQQYKCTASLCHWLHFCSAGKGVNIVLVVYGYRYTSAERILSLQSTQWNILFRSTRAEYGWEAFIQVGMDCNDMESRDMKQEIYLEITNNRDIFVLLMVKHDFFQEPL